MIGFFDVTKIPSSFMNMVKYYKALRNNNSGYKMKYDFSVPEEMLKELISTTPFVGNFLQLTKLNKKIKFFNNNDQDTEHLRGLVNIANTCYMNSIIQCFAHIKELYDYFQKDKTHKLTM